MARAAAGRALVVAVGNPQMGDDGFGLAVLERLRAEGVPPDVVLVDAGTDLLALLDDLAGYARVVVVDAVLSAGPAGRVACHEEVDLRAFTHDAPTGHQVSPLLAIELFRTVVARGDDQDLDGGPAHGPDRLRPGPVARGRGGAGRRRGAPAARRRHGVPRARGRAAATGIVGHGADRPRGHLSPRSPRAAGAAGRAGHDGQSTKRRDLGACRLAWALLQLSPMLRGTSATALLLALVLAGCVGGPQGEQDGTALDGDTPVASTEWVRCWIVPDAGETELAVGPPVLPVDEAGRGRSVPDRPRLRAGDRG